MKIKGNSVSSILFEGKVFHLSLNWEGKEKKTQDKENSQRKFNHLTKYKLHFKMESFIQNVPINHCDVK